jgi:hypothetical protein
VFTVSPSGSDGTQNQNQQPARDAEADSNEDE